MEFFKSNMNVDFMSMKKYTGAVSIILCICAMFFLITKGLNVGLEFTGGTQVEIRFNESVDTDNIRNILQNADVLDPQVQHYGSSKDILIRVANLDSNSEDKIEVTITKALGAEYKDFDVRRVEYIGAEVGNELTEQGGLAILIAIIATMIYIALRFEYRFAISAAVALCHDAIIVLGILSYLEVEFDLSTLAAILAMIGYSLNDTIVVFDRVRENFRKVRNNTSHYVINLSINQTLSRTIMTSWLTLLVVLALLIYGGSSLFGFSLALTLGIIIGTYSSIYVAGAFALSMGLSRADLLPKPKTEIDDMP